MKDKLIIVGVIVAVIVVALVGWVILTQDQVTQEDVPITATDTNTQEEAKAEELASSLTTVIVNGQEAKVDLNAVIKDGKVELTLAQYNVILNSLLIVLDKGEIASKADLALNAILKIDARLKALEEPKQTEVK